MKTVTLGHYRKFGAFCILATFNNQRKNISKRDFHILVTTISGYLSAVLPDYQIKLLESEDAPAAALDEGD